MLSNNQQAFLALVRAGLWEKDVQLLPYGNIDYYEIYRLAQEQSVTGLVAAGLEHIVDTKPPQEIALSLVGDALQLEQRNKSMNKFVAELVVKMRSADIYAILVKGQGIAQCYERPLWRACGDIDLLLSDSNYQNAVDFLLTRATKVEEADNYKQHLPLTISQYDVELHGTLRSALWTRIDRTLDSVQRDVFFGGAVRSWMNGSTQVFLPGVNEDIFCRFAHILQHYFREGIGLRQICDWCRLLWKFRDRINVALLESRLKRAGILSEWKAFSAMVVDYLSMPKEAITLYSSSSYWKRKGECVMSFIQKTGNFGYNLDSSYLSKDPVFIRKMKSFLRLTHNSVGHFFVFPLDAVRSWLFLFMLRLKLTIVKA